MSKFDERFLLAVYDITGIQEYIFASNRMKENAGASFIVGDMVRTHFVDVLNGLGKRAVLTNWHEKKQSVKIFDHPNIKAEVVYSGGGNAVVIYREWSLYHKVNRRFALKVLTKSASLTMATEAIPFVEADNYGEVYQTLMKQLAETKSKQIRTKLAQTLPIFAQEPFKGDAITREIDQLYVSTEQYLKRTVEQKGSILRKDDHRFKFETEDLKKEKGRDSYIAVVHIDGNGIGDWIKKELTKDDQENMSMRIQKHRELSRKITKKFKDIFEKTVEVFRKSRESLPMRPLIIDGDDVTFICQADLAISFTQAFLKNLEQSSDAIRACAGVAFVHSHFPFDLAYEIAEDCCQNAKETYYKEKKERGMQKSYFDFYIVRGSYVKTMAERRKELGELSQKTYHVEELLELQKLIVHLNHAQDWPRSRLVALYEDFLENKDAVKMVKEEAASRGYQEIHHNNRVLFDALQLIDFGKDEEWTNCLDMN